MEARACSSTDRASVFGTEGWGFESLQARHRISQFTVISLEQAQLPALLFSVHFDENSYPDAGWLYAGVGDAVAAVGR